MINFKGNTKVIYDYLRDHPGETLTTAGIAKAIGIVEKGGITSSAPMTISRYDHKLTNPARGVWLYKGLPRPKPAPAPEAPVGSDVLLSRIADALEKIARDGIVMR